MTETVYPATEAAGLLHQLEAERSLSDLTHAALRIWLPLSESAVLSAAPPPDPTAASDQDAQWDYLVDGLILYGVYLIAADAYDRMYTAVVGTPLAVAQTVARTVTSVLPGMPSHDDMRLTVGDTLRVRMGIDVDALDERVRSVPALRDFAARHVRAVRDRVMDATRHVYRRVRAVVDDDGVVDDAERAAAGSVFDPGAPEWAAVADEVGRSQATSALNAASDDASTRITADTGRAADIVWVAILDARTRPDHALANGQRQPVGSPFSVGGETLRYPGDPAGSPSNTVNCRCRLFTYFTAPQQVSASGSVPDTLEDSTMGTYRGCRAVLAVIGTPTDDGRLFASDIALSFRDFPLPLLWQKQSSEGHSNSYTVGVIESAEVSGTEVIGTGYLLDTPEAAEAITQIEHGVTAPSVDLGDVLWELRDAATGSAVSWDNYMDDPDMEVLETVLEAKVLAATLVPIPAFGQTSIELTGDVEVGADALVAAAAMTPPWAVDMPTYPSEAFADPEFAAPTTPHVTENGVIRGHLAVWDVCHTGISDRCQLAPRTTCDYAYFLTSPPVKTDDGETVRVGRLTVGGGHAPAASGVGPAIAHYDETGTCFALVTVGEDAHGIWFSGVPAPGASPERVREGLSAPLSGDWRRVGGHLELVAALAVNTPGFPVLVASGATDATNQPVSLVASLPPCRDDATRATTTLTDDQVLALGRQVAAAVIDENRRRDAAGRLLAVGRKLEAAALISRAMVRDPRGVR